MPRADSLASLDRGLHVVALLRAGPCTVPELAETLDVSRDTVERILASIVRAGLTLMVERRPIPGRHTAERWYSLPGGTLRRVMR